MKRCFPVAVTAFTLLIGLQAWADVLPTVGIGSVYYQNSDDDRRYDQSVDALIPLSHFALTVEGASRWGTNPAGNAGNQEVLVGVRREWSPADFVRAKVGVDRFDAGATPAGMLEAQGKRPAGELRARIEYAPLYETAEMMRNEIMFAGAELHGRAMLAQRFHPAAHLFVRDYSDNNDSVRARGELPLAILVAPVRWELGYRQEYAGFRRQTHHGYFDPDELNSFQGVTSASYWAEALEFYVEVFGGVQSSRRSGNKSTDQFVGGYAQASKKLGAFDLALTAEGDDYSLGSASGFRHVQIGVRLTVNV